MGKACLDGALPFSSGFRAVPLVHIASPSPSMRIALRRNHEKDAANRATLVAALERQLKKGDKSLVGCSFLALVLKKELEDRLAAVGKGARASWPDVIADLASLTETEVEQDGKRFLLRSAPRPAASLALSALGVALPPTLRQTANA